MGKQSGARCETHREIKVFPVVPTPEAIPNRTCNRNTPCVPSALSPSSRSPSPARTLPSTPATTPSPRPVWSRLATPTLVRYVSPRVHHCFVSVASREVTTRARARAARGGSAHVASVRVRPRARPRRILRDTRAPLRSRGAAADLPSPPPFRRRPTTSQGPAPSTSPTPVSPPARRSTSSSASPMRRSRSARGASTSTTSRRTSSAGRPPTCSRS